MLEPHITTGRLDLSYDPEPNMEDVEPPPVHDDFEIMTAESLYSHGSNIQHSESRFSYGHAHSISHVRTSLFLFSNYPVFGISLVYINRSLSPFFGKTHSPQTQHHRHSSHLSPNDDNLHDDYHNYGYRSSHDNRLLISEI
jgi:hypothetical protein